MINKDEHIRVIKKSFKDILFLMNGLNEEHRSDMEMVIDMFIEEKVSKYTERELTDNFSNSKNALKLFYEYIGEKKSDDVTIYH